MQMENMQEEMIQQDKQMNFRIKLFKILLTLFVMVLSIFVLADVVPEMQFVKNTIERVEESEKTIARFSGTTIGVSVAITALPDDFATPLADTLADMNTYFILIYAVLFVEKLIVVEGIGIIFTYFIPCSGILYILSELTKKDVFKKFAIKVFILAAAAVLVIPFSLFFAENIGQKYLDYVNETIEEAEEGANKITDIMNSTDGDQTMFEKLSEAFKTAMQGVEDLMLYFRNVVKKFVNSISILIVTTFIIPLLVLVFFKWLMKEVFNLNLTFVIPKFQFLGKRVEGDKPSLRKIISSSNSNDAEQAECEADLAEDEAEYEEYVEDEENAENESGLESTELEEE